MRLVRTGIRAAVIATIALMPLTHVSAHGGVGDGDGGGDTTVWKPPEFPAIDPDKVYKGLSDLKDGAGDAWNKFWGH